MGHGPHEVLRDCGPADGNFDSAGRGAVATDRRGGERGSPGRVSGRPTATVVCDWAAGSGRADQDVAFIRPEDHAKTRVGGEHRRGYPLLFNIRLP
jgi:hypothetical protein